MERVKEGVWDSGRADGIAVSFCGGVSDGIKIWDDGF